MDGLLSASPAASAAAREPLTYVLPLRRATVDDGDLAPYLRRLAAEVDQVVVVDGSPAAVFVGHAAAWGDVVDHVPVDPDLRYAMGKVNGVLTGVRRAACDKVVVADDDVRYDVGELRRVAALLDDATVVRPQNYFDPLPWHARWDTGRTLLNRLTGGDWPGTLGVRRDALLATGGYDGDVMFENLELVRTLEAAGGRSVAPLDLYVRRLPCSASHFRSQRVRQAFDELARPLRMVAFLAVAPAAATLVVRRRWGALGTATLATVAAAEAGRRRAGGTAVFPPSTAWFAPLWLAERAVCAWLALGARVVRGGVPYAGGVVPRAANPRRVLRRRLAA